MSALAVAAFLLPGFTHGAAHGAPQTAPQTERQYLSGHGPKDAVPWEFSVTAGRRAGQWTTIPVPSNWEQHGFGGYDYGEAPKSHNEHGLYRLKFAVPPAWKGRPVRLVFEGAMTDATVKVNGTLAGPTHIGGFYRFSYDVTPLVKLGKQASNLLEVDVAKISSNARTAVAENKGDYWTLGGIFRPVWLEAAPARSIEHTAIDARADGSFAAEVTLAGAPEGARVEAQIHAADGKPVGAPFFADAPAQPGAKLLLRTKLAAPRLWTAETPNLHTVRLTLRQGAKRLHTSTERFGFRTFEVRKGEGLFLNGKRILIKGVNRHSFRPDTGRALNREDSYADARLIKEMNMNTARMSHYPPDPAFLEAADELGLYVLHELSGWQHSHDTQVGRQLVRELVTRDVNHPSVLFWSNGNEGGWNRELDNDFALYDPQKRNVLHPWELHGDIDTKHYPSYDDLSRRLKGPHLVMPTEFLHALYDGGGGAGMDDYWKAIAGSPFGAGGIFWVFADEGLVRTDRGGKIDVHSTYAPDGLVGPRHEKEGSFHAVRRLWSPVQIADPVLDAQFDGKLAVTNLYDFTSLSAARFAWQLVRYRDPADKSRAPIVLASGQVAGPALAPGLSGALDLKLPATWRKQNADALVVTAHGHDTRPVWSWSWATPVLSERLAAPAIATDTATPRIETDAGEIRLIAGKTIATFNEVTGGLLKLRHGERVSALSNGPRLTYARSATDAAIEWLPFSSEDQSTNIRRLAEPRMANTIEIDAAFEKSIPYAKFKLEISPDGKTWKTLFDASRRAMDGKNFDFPPQQVAALRLSRITGKDEREMVLKSLRLGYAASRFPNRHMVAKLVTSGIGKDPRTGKPMATLFAPGGNGLDDQRWSLHSDGTLQLDYAYKIDGQFSYHGITFDHPEAAMTSLRWLGDGPFRSWQNRLHGTWLAVHETAKNDVQPGESWGYPEFQGFFTGTRWARMASTTGTLTVLAKSSPTTLRVGTPRIDHMHTSVEFPEGDLSFMHAIPAIGSKFLFPRQMGPSGQLAQAAGTYQGSLLFTFKK